MGNHQVTLTVADSEGFYDLKTFNLIVYQLPSFSESIPKKLTLLASNSVSYSLPINQESSDYYVDHANILPRYAKFNFPSYNFFPDKVGDLGISIIEGKLCNTNSCISFKLIIIVTNEPPRFIENL